MVMFTAYNISFKAYCDSDTGTYRFNALRNFLEAGSIPIDDLVLNK